MAFAPYLDAIKESTADRLRSALRRNFSSRIDSLDPDDETLQVILEGLARGRDMVPCEWDPTIPVSAAGVTGLIDAGPLHPLWLYRCIPAMLSS